MQSETKQERIKELLLKEIWGKISNDEFAELELFCKEDARVADLRKDVSSEEFLKTAILDKNKQLQEDVWSEIYKNISYRVFNRNVFVRYAAIAAVLIVFLISGKYIFDNIENETVSIVNPGSSIAYVYQPNEETPIKIVSEKTEFRLIPKNINDKKTTELSPNLHTTIVVPRGGENKIILEDGTMIHLNSETTLTIPTDYSPTNRHICLTGEAYLEVAKDSLHPFTIKTQYADVIVLGTKLNIDSYPDEKNIKVVLENGRVEISTSIERINLPVGMMAVIAENGTVEKMMANVELLTAWHNNRIMYDDEKLVDIMHKLEKWYDFKASFSDDKLRNMTFSMDVSKYETFNSLIEIMKELDEINIEIKNKEILISGK